MHLTKFQRKVLSCTQLRAGTPVTDIARDLSSRVSTVRYALRSMLEKKILVPFACFDLQLCGYRVYEVMLALEYDSPSGRSSAIEVLSSLPAVQWLGQLVGEYEFAVTLVLQHEKQLDDFFACLASTRGVSLRYKQMALFSSWKYFRAKYVYPADNRRESVVISGDATPLELSDTDRAICNFIAHTPLATAGEMSRHLGKSARTIAYRLDRLRTRGVISGIVYGVGYSAAQVQAARLLVYASNPGIDLAGMLTRFCETHPNIVSIARYYGAWDFTITVVGLDTGEIRKTLDDLNARLREYEVRIELHFRLDDLKNAVTMPGVGTQAVKAA